LKMLLQFTYKSNSLVAYMGLLLVVDCLQKVLKDTMFVGMQCNRISTAENWVL